MPIVHAAVPGDGLDARSLGVIIPPGGDVEVSDDIAARLAATGHAVIVEAADKPDKPAKAKKD